VRCFFDQHHRLTAIAIQGITVGMPRESQVGYQWPIRGLVFQGAE